MNFPWHSSPFRIYSSKWWIAFSRCTNQCYRCCRTKRNDCSVLSSGDIIKNLLEVMSMTGKQKALVGKAQNQHWMESLEQSVCPMTKKFLQTSRALGEVWNACLGQRRLLGAFSPHWWNSNWNKTGLLWAFDEYLASWQTPWKLGLTFWLRHVTETWKCSSPQVANFKDDNLGSQELWIWIRVGLVTNTLWWGREGWTSTKIKQEDCLLHVECIRWHKFTEFIQVERP
jgi:hypothetical protein